MPEPKNTNVNLPGAGNWNLPFHPRLTTYGSLGTVDSRGQGMTGREVGVKRGYIRTNPRALDGDAARTPLRYLYFLYNPATISTNYSVQLDNGASAATMDADSSARYIGELSQTLNFSLLFDRTYEVMEGSKEGAWRDVRAALALAGIIKGVDQSAINTTGSDFDIGPMIFMPAYFHFGNQVGGLTYYGYLTGMSIEYTHFSKDMIPIRVGMHMSVNFLPSARPLMESGTTPSDDVEGVFDGRGPLINDGTPDLADMLLGGGTIGSRLWDQ
ncbi:hypothetical protein GCM10010149_89270 [Nonomuraea roseoviolacea subsp. roseoviolacea]|uniref:CIS tube protein n=1 Tax=Nonomuraea roseoviolacea TaxID=103837 RepID=UPI0031DA9601